MFISPEENLPGLGNHPSISPWQEIMHRSNNKNAHITTQKYYQWVCIVLCFQALLFYIPRYLWKTWETGLLRMLVKDLGKLINKMFLICFHKVALF